MNYSIHCISLIERPDRFESAKNTFKKTGIENVNFLRINKHPKGGRYGCYDSHLRVLDNTATDVVIVFEDDCNINEHNTFNWKEVLSEIEKCFNNGFTYFSIANIPLHVSEQVLSPGVLLSQTTCTCGYAIKKSKYLDIRDDLLEAHSYAHIDEMYYKLIPDQVCLKIPLFVQNFADSDNNILGKESLVERIVRMRVDEVFKSSGLIREECDYTACTDSMIFYAYCAIININNFIVLDLRRHFNTLQEKFCGNDR